MDFEKLLLEAKKNELSRKEPIKCLTTKFKPPSKQQREKEKKDRALSEGVLKFLAKKEQEEKQKQEEAERRKAELLALRARDPKAAKRIQTMLKRTKSANKSVMEDAIDNNNTADTLAGPDQPDVDDYGFTSEDSSKLYNKLIQKMYNTPTDENKFAPSKKPNSSNLLGTKERVKMALLRQEEEDKLPHKRSRKSKIKDGEEDGPELNYSAPDRDVSNHSSGSEKEKHDKPKPKKPMPPPVDFQELLRIAEKKQHEPVVVETKVKKSEEPEILMTKKQKLEYEKMQEIKRRRALREQGLDVDDKSKDESKSFKRIPKIGQSNSEAKSSGVTSQKIPKVSQNEQKIKPDISRVSDKIPSKSKEMLDKQKPKSVPDRRLIEGEDKLKKIQREKEELARKLKELEAEERAARLLKENERSKVLSDKSQKPVGPRNSSEIAKRNGEKLEKDEIARKLKEKELLKQKMQEEAYYKSKMLDKNKSPVKNGDSSRNGLSHKSNGLNYKNSVESIRPYSSKPEIKSGSAGTQKLGNREIPPAVKSREFPPKDVIRSRENPPKDVAKGREFPPKDVIRNRQFPPQDVQRKRFPPGDVRRKPPVPVKRRRIESDDEYDSEMDDFIDDGEPEEQIDISKEISQIFKYDKNKYSRYDDDDECMESNFAQISKEEFISTRCGLEEDLRDIQREKAMKARMKNKR